MPEASVTLTSQGEPETCNIGAALARQCAAGDCILLEGDLGTGKTAFARGFIQALQEEREEVVSPTFTLAQSYPTRKGWPVWHFDLYRLRDEKELTEIGFDEALHNGVALIEWPEMAKKRLPAQALTVQLAYGKGAEERRIALHGEASVWQSRLKTVTGKDHAA